MQSRDPKQDNLLTLFTELQAQNQPNSSFYNSDNIAYITDVIFEKKIKFKSLYDIFLKLLKKIYEIKATAVFLNKEELEGLTNLELLLTQVIAIEKQIKKNNQNRITIVIDQNTHPLFLHELRAFLAHYILRTDLKIRLRILNKPRGLTHDEFQQECQALFDEFGEKRRAQIETSADPELKNIRALAGQSQFASYFVQQTNLDKTLLLNLLKSLKDSIITGIFFNEVTIPADIKQEFLDFIKTALSTNKIQTISLINCGLTDDDLLKLMTPLSSTISLKKISLKDNPISSSVAERFSSQLANQSHSVAKLSINGIPRYIKKARNKNNNKKQKLISNFKELDIESDRLFNYFVDKKPITVKVIKEILELFYDIYFWRQQAFHHYFNPKFRSVIDNLHTRLNNNSLAIYNMFNMFAEKEFDKWGNEAQFNFTLKLINYFKLLHAPYVETLISKETISNFRDKIYSERSKCLFNKQCYLSTWQSIEKIKDPEISKQVMLEINNKDNSEKIYHEAFWNILRRAKMSAAEISSWQQGLCVLLDKKEIADFIRQKRDILNTDNWLTFFTGNRNKPIALQLHALYQKMTEQVPVVNGKMRNPNN